MSSVRPKQLSSDHIVRTGLWNERVNKLNVQQCLNRVRGFESWPCQEREKSLKSSLSRSHQSQLRDKLLLQTAFSYDIAFQCSDCIAEIILGKRRSRFLICADATIHEHRKIRFAGHTDWSISFTSDGVWRSLRMCLEHSHQRQLTEAADQTTGLHKH